jgi:hypothetical protein
MFFLTYIQGNLVNEWVKGVNAWLRTQVTTQGWATTDERLWNGVIGAFNRQYADVLEQEKAQAELGRGLRMQNGDLDGLITRFEQLVRHANYDVNQPLVLADLHRCIATRNVRIYFQEHTTSGLRRMARSLNSTTKGVRSHEESTGTVQSKEERINGVSTTGRATTTTTTPIDGVDPTFPNLPDPNAMDLSPGRARLAQAEDYEPGRIVINHQKE